MGGRIPCDSVTPEVEPWWVTFDEPARGLFASGAGEESAVGAACVGMRLVCARRPTSDGRVSWWELGGVERMAVDVGHMPALMRAVRRTGLHGSYRKAGTKSDYRF